MSAAASSSLCVDSQLKASLLAAAILFKSSKEVSKTNLQKVLDAAGVKINGPLLDMILDSEIDFKSSIDSVSSIACTAAPAVAATAAACGAEQSSKNETKDAAKEEESSEQEEIEFDF
ncbi:MAG: hypothetical protein MHMPM18_002862 [Marteilia pararefringens]